MPVLKDKQGGALLRVRTRDGQVEVFVRIDGEEHIISGVSCVDVQEIGPHNILTAKMHVALGGLGDR